MFLISNIHYLINCTNKSASYSMILFFVYNSSLFYRYNIDYKINSFHFGREVVLHKRE
jgi:hypothetical protein